MTPNICHRKRRNGLWLASCPVVWFFLVSCWWNFRVMHVLRTLNQCLGNEHVSGVNSLLVEMYFFMSFHQHIIQISSLYWVSFLHRLVETSASYLAKQFTSTCHFKLVLANLSSTSHNVSVELISSEYRHGMAKSVWRRGAICSVRNVVCCLLRAFATIDSFAISPHLPFASDFHIWDTTYLPMLPDWPCTYLITLKYSKFIPRFLNFGGCLCDGWYLRSLFSSWLAKNLKWGATRPNLQKTHRQIQLPFTTHLHLLSAVRYCPAARRSVPCVWRRPADDGLQHRFGRVLYSYESWLGD